MEGGWCPPRPFLVPALPRHPCLVSPWSLSPLVRCVYVASWGREGRGCCRTGLGCVVGRRLPPPSPPSPVLLPLSVATLVQRDCSIFFRVFFSGGEGRANSPACRPVAGRVGLSLKQRPPGCPPPKRLDSAARSWPRVRPCTCWRLVNHRTRYASRGGKGCPIVCQPHLWLGVAKIPNDRCLALGGVCPISQGRLGSQCHARMASFPRIPASICLIFESSEPIAW